MTPDPSILALTNTGAELAHDMVMLIGWAFVLAMGIGAVFALARFFDELNREKARASMRAIDPGRSRLL